MNKLFFDIFRVKLLLAFIFLLCSSGTAQTFNAASVRSFRVETGAVSRASASEFELKDQYNRSYNVRFPRDKVLILVFGDRKGSSQIESWVRPLYERYTDSVDIYGVAELSAVPSLMQGVVRQIFKSQIRFSVMLDWSGKVSKSYSYQPGKANVILINKKGEILFRQTGAATEGGLNRIYQMIN